MDVVNGWRPLKAGHIHLLCSQCGRKQSNSPRQPDDPANAVVVELVCDKHSGNKADEQFYYDVAGNQMPDPYTPEAHR